MQIGVVFPQTEIGSDPLLIRDHAQTAEALGYSHILAFDHVLGAEHEGRQPPLWGPYTEHDAFHEPLTLFGYLSGLTHIIGLATGVLVLPQRQTALVAKQAAQVQLFSGGRLRLGIGIGWNYVEYEALDSNFRDRGRRQEEQVQVLRALWGEPSVDFQGDWHTIDRAGILPRPTERIHIWFGGFTDRARERAARIGDGFMFSRREAGDRSRIASRGLV